MHKATSPEIAVPAKPRTKSTKSASTVTDSPEPNDVKPINLIPPSDRGQIQQVTPSPKACDMVDIAFLMDVSRDISPPIWAEEYHFFNSFVRAVSVGKNKILVGVISIGNVPVTRLLLKDSTDKHNLRQSIAAIRLRPRDKPEIAKSLTNVQHIIFVPKNGARSLATKMVVLLTVCSRKLAFDSIRSKIVGLTKAGIHLTVICLGSRHLDPVFNRAVAGGGGEFTDINSFLQHRGPGQISGMWCSPGSVF